MGGGGYSAEEGGKSKSEWACSGIWAETEIALLDRLVS